MEETTDLPEEMIIEDLVVSPLGDAKDRHYMTVRILCSMLSIRLNCILMI